MSFISYFVLDQSSHAFIKLTFQLSKVRQSLKQHIYLYIFDFVHGSYRTATVGLTCGERTTRLEAGQQASLISFVLYVKNVYILIHCDVTRAKKYYNIISN